MAAKSLHDELVDSEILGWRSSFEHIGILRDCPTPRQSSTSLPSYFSDRAQSPLLT